MPRPWRWCCLPWPAAWPALQNVQNYGRGGATSVMRAADKFGQMLGPLTVGALFASMGISGGLAVTGAFYLLATLAFLLIAPLAIRQRAKGQTPYGV
jgi:hypothetical protein